MDIPHQKRIQKLLKEIDIIDINDRSNLEELCKYVKKNTKNIFVGLHPCGKAYHYHTHDFYEVNYLYEGDCVNIVDGEKLYMTSGDFVIMHPGTFHTIYAESQSVVVNILVRASFFDEVLSSAEENGTSLLAGFMSTAKDKAYYKYMMCKAECVREEVEALMEEEWAGRFNRDMIQVSLFLSLICKLLRGEIKAAISGKQNVNSNVLMDILEYISEHYAVTTLNHISERFGYSTAHICRMFVKETGKSFSRIVTEIRMNKALTYLADTDLKMYEIARLLGYESHEYFQRVFKKHFGVTPFKCRQLDKETM
ncbi:MAG: helix-turn-helix domain-containing protein [Clostridia bacterium]|nr:helix-turn-helix domain-containing protein [Clostridia bacterium]